MSASTHYVPRTTDHKISIQRGAPGRNASGGEILTWTELCTRWAAISYQAGGESSTSRKETAAQIIVFRTRYVPGLTEKDRILYDSQYYDIISIQADGRRHYHTITTQFRR
jgi:SPP1 family predicted phage head-tail adaptor